MDPDDPDEPDDRRSGARGDDPPDGWSTPLPPDDRLWRHPSEVGEPPGPAGPAPTGVVAPAWTTLLASAVIGSFVAVGLLGASGLLSREPGVRETVVREAHAPIIPAANRAGAGTVERIADEAGPAVVRVEVRGDLDGSGSGVLFRDDGHVLTNAHVVDEAERIMVVLSDGSTYEAELVGTDRITDIAVIKAARPEPFRHAVLGTAVGLVVGQPTVAIGSPLGLLGGSSVTTGVVSALGRTVEGPEGPPLLDMIQTDAAIAPGSSGGALLDMRGSVIGITTAIAVSQVGAEGLGFAVPIDLAVRVGGQIIERGRAIHVWLGIEGRDLDAAEAADAGLPGGAEVVDLIDGSPAADGGLLPGDLIVAVDDRPVPSMSGLVVGLRDHAPGAVVVVTLVRGDAEVLAEITLEERPS